jgi:hypothetical protein
MAAAATSVEEAVHVAQEIGYPVMLRIAMPWVALVRLKSEQKRFAIGPPKRWRIVLRYSLRNF